MHTKVLLSIIALLSLIFVHVNSAQASDSPSEQTMVLEQYSHVAGRIFTFVNPHALRINIENKEIFLVATAPSWRVVFFNSKTNCAMDLPLNEWLKHQAEWSYINEDNWLGEETVMKTGDITRFGVKCEELCLASPTRDGHLVKKPKNMQATLIDVRNAQTPAQACQICWHTLNLPPLNGIPVQCVLSSPKKQIRGMSSQGGEERVFRTDKISQVTCDKDFFVYPKGFKTVKREVDVVGTAARSKRAEPFLDFFK